MKQQLKPEAVGLASMVVGGGGAVIALSGLGIVLLQRALFRVVGAHDGTFDAFHFIALTTLPILIAGGLAFVALGARLRKRATGAGRQLRIASILGAAGMLAIVAISAARLWSLPVGPFSRGSWFAIAWKVVSLVLNLAIGSGPFLALAWATTRLETRHDA